MEKLGKPKANRLVFLTSPFQGHINPMLQLATILHSKGFSITIVHLQFNSPNPSNHPQFTFKPITDNLSESKVLQGDILGTVKALNKNCQVPFELYMKQMTEKEDSDDRISCIVYDGLMYFAHTVANNLKLPGIIVRTSAAAGIFNFTVFPHPHQQGYISLLGDLLGDIKVLNKICQLPFELCMNKMLEKEDRDNPISCVIYDVLMHCAQTVANRLKLPGIALRTSAAATILSYFAVFPNPLEKGFGSLLDSMAEEFSTELQSLKLKELHASIKTEYPPDAVLELRAIITSAIKDSSAIIINTMSYLEREALTKIQDIFNASIFPVGPFHKLAPTVSNSLLQEDRSCISWLDKQAPKSVLYVSFGSIVSMTEDELLEVAWGLANSELPFLWVLRPGLVRGSDLLEPLPEIFKKRVEERGCIVEWAPQQDLLAHSAVGGFWTHCGWNSTLESICEGVPMLCRPFFGDQFLNVRYVCHLWRVGLELEELEREKIVKAIRKLMVDGEGEEVRQRAVEFKEKAKLCQIEGGSSYCSLNDLAEHISSY
ncbi:UDP-glucose iridoid glucosyltransferase isoform X1 [Hevea brasiliensis]|uniref:UDP-glucose iridoid glucosyltransferase isoform X1 n=1 Tax=Hevea brasiliensis TaxID=3981 RepID=UPI0025EA7C93|nr:UDP-glucose iridoid glucosyltransferase isoform X1 [Hevea brasiliensis]